MTPDAKKSMGVILVGDIKQLGPGEGEEPADRMPVGETGDMNDAEPAVSVEYLKASIEEVIATNLRHQRHIGSLISQRDHAHSEHARLLSRLVQVADYVVRREGDWWTVLDPDGPRIRVAPVGSGDHERSALDVLDGLIDSAAARHEGNS